MKAVLWVVEARHSRQYAWIAVAAATARADARKAQEVNAAIQQRKQEQQ